LSTPTQTDEERKAERLAKLDAWKQKQAAERDRKQREIDTSGGTRNLLDEMDKKAKLSPAFESPAPPDSPVGDASPTPYGGKFDPKAIAKKATASSTGVAKLGTDIALPDIAKASPIIHSNSSGLKANKTADALTASIGK
jgi:ATP-dependent RNA helicase DDX46/PRP5